MLRAAAGASPNKSVTKEKVTAYAQYFTGTSYLAMLAQQELQLAHVTFEPGCRNNWHIHTAETGGGQILICTGGSGWYQAAGQPAQALQAGDVVEIPANVKHWHGATKDSWFSHIAIAVPGTNTGNEWLEAVDDAHYAALDS